jgi:hypothetical protein
MRCAVWVALALTLAACSSSTEGARSSQPPSEGGTTDGAFDVTDAPQETDGGTGTGKDASVIIIQYPTVNSDVCPVSSADLPLLVCFAADPAPYSTYLGAAATVGTCPKTTDFAARCAACGPLTPSIAASLDAGQSSDCCLFLKPGCGP